MAKTHKKKEASHSLVSHSTNTKWAAPIRASWNSTYSRPLSFCQQMIGGVESVTSTPPQFAYFKGPI
jgi:hypothetical protein